MAPHKSERLCFIQVESANKTVIWWPSLFYDSWREMMSDLPHALKAKSVLCRNDITRAHFSIQEGVHWALLLGLKRPTRFGPDCFLSLIIPDERDSKMQDFFLELEDMKSLYHGNPQWNLAIEEACFLLKEFTAVNVSSTCSSPGDTTLTVFQLQEESSTSFQLPSLTNAASATYKNDSDNGNHADFDVNGTDDEPSSDEKKQALLGLAPSCDRHEETHYSPKHNYDTNSTNMEDHQHGVNISGKGRKSLKDDNSTSDQESMNEAIPKESNAPKESNTPSSCDKLLLKKEYDNEDGLTMPQNSKKGRKDEEIDAARKESAPGTPISNDSSGKQMSPPKAANSPLSPSTPSAGISRNSLANQVTPQKKCDQKTTDSPCIVAPIQKRTIHKRAPWTEVFDILQKDHGFSRVYGSGLVPEYFVTAELRGCDEKHIQQNLKEGKEYLKGEDGLKSYAHQRYGWIGEKGREFIPIRPGKRRTEKKESNSIKNSPNLLLPEKRKIEKKDPWTRVYDILTKEHGLYRIKGNSEYYVPLDYKEMDAKYIRDNLKEGKDYHEGEEGLKKHAHYQFNWIGEEGREYIPLKKRRRCTESSGDESVTKSIAKKTKTNGKVTKQKNTSTPKKGKISTTKKQKSPSTKKGTPPSTKKSTRGNSSDKSSGRAIDFENCTVKGSLEKALNNLNVNTLSKETLFDGSESASSFQSNHNKIVGFLQKATNIDNSESSLMYLCGNPGLGKTTLVNHCVEAAVGGTGKKQQIYLNASSLSSAEEILSKIAEKVVKKTNLSRNTIEKALSVKSGQKARDFLILVVDEIDVLIKKSFESKKDTESALSCIFRWASDPTFKLTLIGISNKVGSEEARLLHKQAKIGEELVFQPYTESDLVGIIQKRLGTNKDLVQEKAIVFASRKVAKQSGDAREILDIIRRAIVECKQTLSAEELSSIEMHEPVVRLPHVLKATQQAGGAKSTGEIIMELPQKAKVVLCVASALNQVSEAWTDIPLKTLKDMCDEATHHNVISDSMSIEDFDGFIGRLVDDGLIEHTSAELDDCSSEERLIQVGAQLEDVEFAIKESSLLENAFYKRIVEYVRKNNINNL